MNYIALLRGINIGGHRVKMENLRALFSELELRNVRSYIQTGNVFFEADAPDVAALTTRIEAHLETNLGNTVPTFLRTPAALEHALLPNPFEKIEVTPDTRLLVVFVRNAPTDAATSPVRSPDGAMEIMKITNSEIFVVYRLKNQRPPDVAAWLKRTLGLPPHATTARFYDTTLKMLRADQATETEP